jgi:hypothetical protein
MGTTMNFYTGVEDGMKRQASGKLHAALAAAPSAVDVRADVPVSSMGNRSQAHA